MSEIEGNVNVEFDEHALVERLRTRDDEAFERMIRRYLPRMLVVAQRILGNEADACDAIQDAFLSVFKAINGFDGNSSFVTWLHRIVVNASLMKLRSRTRRPEQSIEALLPRFQDDGHHVDPPTPWTENASHVLEVQETRDQVRRAIDQLPESYRTVLLLRDIEQLDTEETARLLGINVGAVKTRLHRARLALRTLLDPLFRGDHG